MASIVDYQESLRLSRYDPSFAALMFALIRKADTWNRQKIFEQWPEFIDEFNKRYNSPGGALDAEELQYIQAQEG